MASNVEVEADGWLLIPSSGTGKESEEFSQTVFNPTTTPGVFTATSTSATGRREWRTREDWWFVDGTAMFGPGLSALGGFRYEHYSVTFKDPSDSINALTSLDPRSDLTINSYQPFVGVQYRAICPVSCLTVKASGFPFVPADIRVVDAIAGIQMESKGNFGKSVFLETFAEYTQRIVGDASVGAFFRWNWLYGLTNLNTDIASISGSDRAAFNRSTVTVGGTFTLSFVSPL